MSPRRLIPQPESSCGRGVRLLLFLLLLGAALPSAARATAEDLRQHLLVVYNKNAVEGEKLARYYAEKRQIAADHVLGIDCPDVEEIDRATYNDKLRAPIDAYLVSQGWITRETTNLAAGPKSIAVQVATRNDIWCLALIRGIPLRIQNDPLVNDTPHLKPELNTNAASVDSELATLPILGLPMNGPALNPYYFAGYAREFDALDARRQILVARLDAPAVSDVQRMIDESLVAETNRLTGNVCLDARGFTDKNNPYVLGDDWLRNALISLAREGWPIEFDNNPDLIAANLPINQIALYAGWYTTDAQGPFFQPPRRFATGAIAYHLHSFSASTLRSRTANWCGPLLSAGAAATMGCVYEPYLDLTPHIDIFIDRLLQGYTLVEAGTMSQKGLSWMVTIVGDPLYRPFREKFPEALTHAREQNSINLEWLELQQARLSMQNGIVSPATLKKQLINSMATEISWEGYADLLATSGSPADLNDSLAAYRQAMKLCFGAVDQIRIGLKMVRLAAKTRQPDVAKATLKQLAQRWPRDVTFYGLDTELTRLTTGGAPVPVNVPPSDSTSAPVPASTPVSEPATAP